MPVTTKSRPTVRSSKPPLRERVARDASLIGPGVARFLPPATPRLDPFPAYVVQPQSTGPCPVDFPARPRYSRTGSTSVVRVDCPTGASFYGTGEQAGPLKRNGTRKVLWNTDAFDYTDRSPSLYQAHPFVLVLLPDGSAMGIIAETTRRCEIDLRKDVTFRVKGPAPAITIIKRDHPRDVVRELARLTGYMPLPPRWALGYHQCRWSYEPESRVIEIAQGFRDRSIPCDVIWLDIDYMNGFRCFTFDAEKFPDPKAMNAKLHSMGFRSIYMIDPGIKVDDQYSVYTQGRDGDHFVKNAAGREYHGKVWPGMCAFPDFTRARTRAWWASLYKDFLAQGIDGVWNDMNEPAVFDVPGKTMPDSNHHDADPELGGPGPHATFHNVYGMLMVRASREGMAAARPDRRPFILTRANFLGGQRYAATWTGDNRSDWHHLRWSIATTINLGLSGQPLSGPDIGGFVGDASPELFARFMGIAALLPFTRAHSIKDSINHEPWSFGTHCETICRLALLRRYRLLPYLYTLAHHASLTGDPIVRPLFYADPTDVRLRAADSSFLLGDDLLVRCSTAKNSFECPDPMPRGDWREITLVGERDEHALPRLFLRAGAALPLAPASMTTDDAARAELALLAAPDARGEARATHYHDAGDGYAHEKGDRRITRYLVKDGRAQIEYFDGPESPAGPLPQVETV